MQKKLTISVDAEVYDGLLSVVGRRRISRFLSDLAGPWQGFAPGVHTSLGKRLMSLGFGPDSIGFRRKHADNEG